MRGLMAILAATLVLIVSQVGAKAGESVANPDATSIALLQYRMAGVSPPFDDLAEREAATRRVDEFHRADLLRRIEGELRAKVAALDDVRQVAIALRSRFAEYDAANGEYDFDINDGTYIPFTAFGRQWRVALTNGTRAQIWKIAPSDAENVLRKNKGDRLVMVILTLELLPSPPSSEGEPAVLNARIVRYDILANITEAKLGSVTVATAP